jgi:chaperonin GroES
LESTKFDLIEPEEFDENESKANIILSDRAKEKQRRGKVLKVRMNDELAEKIKIGDTIIYAKFSGDEVELEDKRYLIISRSDILAVIR